MALLGLITLFVLPRVLCLPSLQALVGNFIISFDTTPVILHVLLPGFAFNFFTSRFICLTNPKGRSL
jgi:hypothetical protein